VKEFLRFENAEAKMKVNLARIGFQIENTISVFSQFLLSMGLREVDAMGDKMNLKINSSDKVDTFTFERIKNTEDWTQKFRVLNIHV
jgi:hypothetical protein